jgi:hypothetical protein
MVFSHSRLGKTLSAIPFGQRAIPSGRRIFEYSGLVSADRWREVGGA